MFTVEKKYTVKVDAFSRDENIAKIKANGNMWTPPEQISVNVYVAGGFDSVLAKTLLEKVVSMENTEVEKLCLTWDQINTFTDRHNWCLSRGENLFLVMQDGQVDLVWVNIDSYTNNSGQCHLHEYGVVSTHHNARIIVRSQVIK